MNDGQLDLAFRQVDVHLKETILLIQRNAQFAILSLFGIAIVFALHMCLLAVRRTVSLSSTGSSSACCCPHSLNYSPAVLVVRSAVYTTNTFSASTYQSQRLSVQVSLTNRCVSCPLPRWEGRRQSQGEKGKRLAATEAPEEVEKDAERKG